MAESGDAMFIHCARMRRFAVKVALLGVFKSHPRVLLPGQVILLLMGFSRSAMSVGGSIMQFVGPLVILEMRSIAVCSRH